MNATNENTPNSVIDHYDHGGDFMERIYSLACQNDAITEMHIGGSNATEFIIDRIINTPKNQNILDLGSGLGGAARHIVRSIKNVSLTTIDLTPALVKVAKKLNSHYALNNHINAKVGDATNTPFKDQSFDIITTIHTAMNIENKEKLYQEAFRLLRSDGYFVLYDVIALKKDAKPDFPLPWATQPDFSFLETPDVIADLLRSAGFNNILVEDKTEFANKSIEFLLDKLSDPTMSKAQETVMGPLFKEKISNLASALQNQICGAVLITSKKYVT